MSKPLVKKPEDKPKRRRKTKQPTQVDPRGIRTMIIPAKGKARMEWIK